jgi:hypothetical protein
VDRRLGRDRRLEMRGSLEAAAQQPMAAALARLAYCMPKPARCRARGLRRRRWAIVTTLKLALARLAAGRATPWRTRPPRALTTDLPPAPAACKAKWPSAT